MVKEKNTLWGSKKGKNIPLPLFNNHERQRNKKQNVPFIEAISGSLVQEPIRDKEQRKLLA